MLKWVVVCVCNCGPLHGTLFFYVIYVKKNSRTGEFREIAYSPSLRNSVATVCKSGRRVIKVLFRSQYSIYITGLCWRRLSCFDLQNAQSTKSSQLP